MSFYKELGYTFNEKYTDETAACLVISDIIYAMLITENKFREFTPKAICDAHQYTEVLNCLSAESKDAVNDLVDKAIKSGATEHMQARDYGFMYSRAFNDPDGHVWEMLWMDESAA